MDTIVVEKLHCNVSLNIIKIEISELDECDSCKFVYKRVRINDGSFYGIIHEGITGLFKLQEGWTTIWFEKHNCHLEILMFAA